MKICDYSSFFIWYRKSHCGLRVADPAIAVRFMLPQRKQRRSLDGGDPSYPSCPTACLHSSIILCIWEGSFKKSQEEVRDVFYRELDAVERL